MCFAPTADRPSFLIFSRITSGWELGARCHELEQSTLGEKVPFVLLSISVAGVTAAEARTISAFANSHRALQLDSLPSSVVAKLQHASNSPMRIQPLASPAPHSSPCDSEPELAGE